MAEPNLGLTAETEGQPRDVVHHHEHHLPPLRADSASAVCYMAADPAQGEHSPPRDADSREDGEATPSQSHSYGDDSTPRSEVPSQPSLPDAVTASLLSQMHPLQPEPSYFSPQPRRLYASHIPRSTPASTEPSPTSSANASVTSISVLEPSIAEDAVPYFGSTAHSNHPERPVFQRDLSTASTASNTTVRAPSADSDHAYSTSSSSQQLRDGPVYPNQSYAALHLQQYPIPHAPPIYRSRSTHPAHSAANSLSSLATFGHAHEHYRDIMDSGPRTVGNSPVSSPGLFDPNNRRPKQIEPPQPNDGLYSPPWLHPTHRQAPKETHIADVQADPISGRKIVNQYEIVDELGRGMHGKVKLGKDLNHGGHVAIKIVDRYSKRRRLGKSSSHEDKIKREIAILKKARHPNIVSLLEVIDDPAKKKVYIVLEHVELGEVKWRAEGAREICLVEWRRFKRESKGIFDNESAAMEDERIIRAAHQKLAREQRRRNREAHFKRQNSIGNEPWSLEFNGDSEDDESEAGRSSRASGRNDNRSSSRIHIHKRQDAANDYESNMETAFRSTTLASNHDAATGLEGTMYGAYDADDFGRTPSIAGSSSSRLSECEEDLPEHFRYVPLMTTQAAWEAIKDTVLGLEYLHYQNVYHRDIKPANLLVTKEHRIKISDFGVSYLGRSKTQDSTGDQSESEFQDEDEAVELAKTVGTPAFYAPELCRTDPDAETPKIDGGIDVWALGVTLYCLIYGRVPFHDWNAFTLMKVISEEEPYIPLYRLKPVAERSASRPSSHGRNSQPTVSSKRAEHDLEYEEVDERLRDLMKRLLEKDNRKRITIPEIKRHPWILSGISNSNAWVDETDPGREAQGRKIEISNEDLDKAVVPIGWVDRVRSTVKKGADFVTKSFRTSGSRRRAQSSAANQDAPPAISANSSSSTISQDGRRGSLVPGYLLEAIRTSRESEHPLSHSVTASPEARERSKFFDSPNSRTASPAQGFDSQRPALQDRAISSVHTIRHSDLMQGRSTSPAMSPALPGTPTALDTPGGSNLGGLFGGLPRRVVNSMRSKDKLKPPREHMRAKSIDRLVSGDDDAHGVPSLAVSTSVASGHVDQPDALKDLSPIARGPSPSFSETRSHGQSDTASRQSSLSSISSRLHRNWAHANDLEIGPTLEIPSVSQHDQFLPLTAPINVQSEQTLKPKPHARETSKMRFDRAKDELMRCKVREANLEHERSNSATQSRPSTAVSQTACPPSPDDEAYYQNQKVQDYLSRHDPSSENSPVGDQERGLAFCSSEEQFTPMSQSTSNPSIPSVASAGSSAPDECINYQSMIATASTDSFHNQFDAPIDDPAGYDGDHAVESEDDDSEEDMLFIGRRKPTQSHRSESISVAEIARSDIRQEIVHNRRRSARSGSNGTVKKIPPPEESAGHDNTRENTSTS